jgi:hypothetical protein
MVTCPLVPGVPHLVSGFSSSPRAFALGFLPTPPRGDAVALSLPFGFSYTWRGDSHPASYVPCPAHTPELRRTVCRVAFSFLLDLFCCISDKARTCSFALDCGKSYLREFSFH